MLDIQTDSDIILSSSEQDVDLRRGVRRDTADIVIRRAAYLSADDRMLVQAIYARGSTLKELAALTGRGERALGRRLRVVVRRVQSPEFTYVIQRPGQFLPSAGAGTRTPLLLRRLAKECILEGKPVRTLAREVGLSYHLLRQKHAALRAMALVAPPQREHPADPTPAAGGGR
jgi:hypothetical protein